MRQFEGFLPIGLIVTFAIWLHPLSTNIVFGQDNVLEGLSDLDAKRDWPFWRGLLRNGHSLAENVPTKFDEKSNLKWKVPVPGRGHASPIVVGSKVFLSTSDAEAKTHSVLAFQVEDGKQLWSVQLNEGGFPEKNHAKNTEATPTVASDGKSLFVSYYHHDAVHLIALNMDGKQLWNERVDRFRPKLYEYGYAPSPIIYGDTVIVAYEYDGPSAIVARSRKTGGLVWKADRQSSISFSTPVIANIGGQDQLLITGQATTNSYDPSNGKLLWSTPGPAVATCGTAVWEGSRVFVSGGFPQSETLAIDAANKGKVLWRNKEKCYEQSMIVVNGYLYALTDKGIMFCWRAEDGKEMWKERLQGPVSASPVLVKDRIYWANELGTMYVMKANPDKFELLAENQIGNSSFASPAISGDRLLLRIGTQDGSQRKEFLYCFGG